MIVMEIKGECENVANTHVLWLVETWEGGIEW